MAKDNRKKADKPKKLATPASWQPGQCGNPNNINQIGRPSKYTDELASEICYRLASGETLTEMCQKYDHMPDRQSVYNWLMNNAGFSADYLRAREIQADNEDDRIRQLSNDVLAGVYEPNAARIALLAMQWRAARLKPKQYGDKQIIENDIGPNLLEAIENARNRIKQSEPIVIDNQPLSPQSDDVALPVIPPKTDGGE